MLEFLMDLVEMRNSLSQKKKKEETAKQRKNEKGRVVLKEKNSNKQKNNLNLLKIKCVENENKENIENNKKERKREKQIGELKEKLEMRSKEFHILKELCNEKDSSYEELKKEHSQEIFSLTQSLGQYKLISEKRKSKKQLLQKEKTEILLQVMLLQEQIKQKEEKIQYLEKEITNKEDESQRKLTRNEQIIQELMLLLQTEKEQAKEGNRIILELRNKIETESRKQDNLSRKLDEISIDKKNLLHSNNLRQQEIKELHLNIHQKEKIHQILLKEKEEELHNLEMSLDQQQKSNLLLSEKLEKSQLLLEDEIKENELLSERINDVTEEWSNCREENSKLSENYEELRRQAFYSLILTCKLQDISLGKLNSSLNAQEIYEQLISQTTPIPYSEWSNFISHFSNQSNKN